MKSPLFLRNLLLQAVGDSSVGILFTSDNKQSRSAKKVRKYFPLLLLLGSAGMVYPLLKAEEVKNWPVAQASLISILVLLAAALCFWWQAQDRIADFSVAAATYHRALEKLLWCVAVGILAMIAVATQSKHWKYGIVSRAIGYGILIAGFCFIFGVLLGYLFGLRPTDNSEKLTGQSSLPHPNTNLAEIADWLTKIILGAGLVQLTNMPRPIWAFAQKMALGAVQGDKVGQPWEAPNPAVALAIMGFFSSCGLLYGYLWTRYEDAVTAYGAGDASAAALVSRWLNSPTTPDDPTCSNMVDAVKNTSSTARIRIFLQAEDYRKSATEDANERSLPVLQALVDADSVRCLSPEQKPIRPGLDGKKERPQNLQQRLESGPESVERRYPDSGLLGRTGMARV